MAAVIGGVLIQDRALMTLPAHQHPVGDLGPDGADPAFGIGVRSRAARRDLYHLDPGAARKVLGGVVNEYHRAA